MANEAEKKVENIVKETKTLIEQQAELNKKIKESAQNYQNTLEAMRKYSSGAYRGVEDIIASTVRLNVNVKQLAQANKDGYEYLNQKNKLAIEANQKQIEALSKNISKQEELLASHEKQSELIVEKGILAKAQIEEEYELLGRALVGVKNYDAEYSQLMEERNEKILVADKETKDQLLQNSLALHLAIEEQGKTSANAIIEHVGEVVKNTSGAWKGVIVVEAQKEHLDTARLQLEAYLENLKTFGKKVYGEYGAQLNNYKLTTEDKKKIEQEREAFMQKHNKFVTEETARVTKETEKIEKASQNLRLTQFKEYTEKAASVAKAVAERTKIAADAGSNAFKQLSASYTEEAAKITQKLEDNKTANYEALQEYEANKAEHEARNADKQKEIDAETIKMGESTNEEEKRLSQEKINTLESEKVTTKSIEAEFAIETAKLTNDKRKAEKKAKQAEKIQKKIELGQQIVTAIGDIAAGTAKALSYGPILGPILAGIVAAAGAMQVAVMTKQFEKFEDGGLLRGSRHSSGGMRILGSNIEVEGGEYVVNRESTDKNLGLIRYINSQRRELAPGDLHGFFARSSQGFEPPFRQAFAQGGQLPNIEPTTNIDHQLLVQAIRSIRFEPKVSVTDINTVQSDMVRVDAWTGM